MNLRGHNPLLGNIKLLNTLIAGIGHVQMPVAMKSLLRVELMKCSLDSAPADILRWKYTNTYPSARIRPAENAGVECDVLKAYKCRVDAGFLAGLPTPV